MSTSTIRGIFQRDDGQRMGLLEDNRRCAALTKPWVMPPADLLPSSRLTDSHTSIGTQGVTKSGGRLLSTVFPPTEQYFVYELDPEIQLSTELSDEFKRQAEERLYLRQLVLRTLLEGGDQKASPGQLIGMATHRPRAFYTVKRSVMEQLVVIGSCLEYLGDDFRLKSYRLDQYVTCRDSSTDVLYHIAKDRLSARSLSPQMAEKAKVRIDDAMAGGALPELFTRIEWHQNTRKWVIEQECNGQLLVESEETVNPFWATEFDLIPGEHYGRGYVAQHRGTLHSVDSLERKMDAYAGAASKVHPVLDHAAILREKDLMKPSGAILRGKVVNGQVADAAMLGMTSLPSFEVVHQTLMRKNAQLGKAFLLEAESAPKGEQGRTAYAWQRVAQELDDQMGGMYASICDDQVVPMIQRAEHVAQKRGLLPVLPPKATSIRLVTGLAALSRESEKNAVLTLAQIASALGEQAIGRIDMGVLFNIVRRTTLNKIHPGLVKSDEQMKQEQQAAIAQQVQMQAAEQAIKTGGNLIEGAAQAAPVA